MACRSRVQPRKRQTGESGSPIRSPRFDDMALMAKSSALHKVQVYSFRLVRRVRTLKAISLSIAATDMTCVAAAYEVQTGRG